MYVTYNNVYIYTHTHIFALKEVHIMAKPTKL